MHTNSKERVSTVFVLALIRVKYVNAYELPAPIISASTSTSSSF